MIGELDIAAAIEEQQELFARVVERVDHNPGDTDSLFDYSGNLGVDFDGLMTIVSDYVRTRPLSFIAPRGRRREVLPARHRHGKRPPP